MYAWCDILYLWYNVLYLWYDTVCIRRLVLIQLTQWSCAFIFAIILGVVPGGTFFIVDNLYQCTPIILE